MGYYPQESLYKPYKYHGYTVRGTPNCPLIVFSSEPDLKWIATAESIQKNKLSASRNNYSLQFLIVFQYMRYGWLLYSQKNYATEINWR